MLSWAEAVWHPQNAAAVIVTIATAYTDGLLIDNYVTSAPLQSVSDGKGGREGRRVCSTISL